MHVCVHFYSIDPDCTEVIIEEYEFSKRVTLEINGADYTIRIWDFHPLDNDKKGHVCRAVVSYTLFMMAKKEDGSVHREEIDNNSLMITW